jgi:hypothetical protein
MAACTQQRTGLASNRRECLIGGAVDVEFVRTLEALAIAEVRNGDCQAERDFFGNTCGLDAGTSQQEVSDEHGLVGAFPRIDGLNTTPRGGRGNRVPHCGMGCSAKALAGTPWHILR